MSLSFVYIIDFFLPLSIFESFNVSYNFSCLYSDKMSELSFSVSNLTWQSYIVKKFDIV